MFPRGATPLRRPIKKPAVKRRIGPVSLCENGSDSSDSPRLDNGGVSGKDYWALAAVCPSTPRSIHRLRCCLLSSFRRLSVARFDRYSSGSMSLLDVRLKASIASGDPLVKLVTRRISHCATMAAMNELGKLLIVVGAGLLVVGALLVLGARLPWFGNLPGDIVVKRDNFTLYAPIGTMILVSILLTILLNVIGRFFR